MIHSDILQHSNPRIAILKLPIISKTESIKLIGMVLFITFAKPTN